MIDKKGYQGSFVDTDFTHWIQRLRANYTKVQPYFDKARDYFENLQEPDEKPADKAYIVENRVNDLVRRLTGQLISGKTKLTLRGLGDLMDAAKLLFNNILDYNKFQTQHMENIGNHFYCEGYAGIKYRFNPYKKSRYGIGSPDIFSLMSNELWLDSDNRDLLHKDDNVRITPTQMLLSEAKKRFPKYATKITKSMMDKIDGYKKDNDEVQHYCTVYEIEFKETFFKSMPAQYLDGTPVLDDQGNQKKIRIEEDRYFLVKVVNETLVVEGPVDTGYPTFRLIPVIHTPTKSATFGGYPFGPPFLFSDSQDHLNVIKSMMLEAIKSDIKTFAVFSGATAKELAEYDAEAGKMHGKISLKGESAKVMWAPKTGLAPALVQMYEIMSHSIDTITGKFAPERGEIKGDISGRAINLLQSQGIASEYVGQAHIESSLTDLATVILHSMKTDMQFPFYIDTTVDGTTKQQRVYFNYNPELLDEQTGVLDNPLNVIDENASMINNLKNMQFEPIVEVELNSIQQQQVNIQKAMALSQQQKLATEDLLKTMYPKDWAEKYENLQSENTIIGLVTKMNELLGPEQVQQIMAMVDQMAQAAEETEGGGIPSGGGGASGPVQPAVSGVPEETLPAGSRAQDFEGQ
jgi:hypothetical protein